jgi:LacI family transcriptional regulator
MIKPAQQVTIKDVAAAAGVSYATVSRVLNGYDHVSPEKRARVLEAAEQLGYVANLQARSLAGGRTGVIGVLLPGLDNQYMALVAQGIDEAVSTAGYELMLHTAHRNRTDASMVLAALTRGLTDGLLLLVHLPPLEYLEKLHAQHFPYVVVDHAGFDAFSSTVTAMNWQGGYDATRHLIELGHRRIAHVAGTPDISSAAERLAAYKQALADCGLPFDPALVQTGEFERLGGFQAAARLLALDEPPTAIFAANDLSALGVYDAARERGLRIPDDLSVIGFDDILSAAFVHPRLTTIRQPLVEIGQAAARLLLQRIEDPQRPRDTLVLPTELVIRDSCAPVRAAHRPA